MKYRKEIITTAGTLACAIGIGFFMQNSQSARPSYFEGATLVNADAAILDVGAVTLTSAEYTDANPSPSPSPATSASGPEDTLTLAAAEIAVAPAPEVQAAAIQTVAAVADAEMPAAPQAAPAPKCDITTSARPMAAAMVNLTLSAPCMPDERVTVHHSGLLFSQTTDSTGALDITVPALAQEAVFIIAFTNGEGGVAQTTVEEIFDFDRVVLQWKGETGFQLHAREFGADYGTEGHVWSGAAGDMSYGVTGKGGYLSLLGDPDVPDGLMAEVYTFPVTSSQSSGKVGLSIETEVAGKNCGQEIEARTLQTFSGNDITSRNLTLSVPDCDATGNFLVLNNLFEDMKVASN